MADTPRPARVPDAPPITAALTPRAAALVLTATILGSTMAFVDGTIVNVALPALRDQFDADVAGLQWIIDGYLLPLVALLLVAGRLGDVYGRRAVFAAGVVLFAAASAACGAATSLEMLLAARAVKGVGSALLVPGSLAILTDCFAGEARGRAIGTWSAASALSVALAPLAGGWLIEHASWRWIFYINLPLAAATLVATFAAVPRLAGNGDGAAGRRHARLDWTGAVLISLALFALVLALVEGGRLGFGHPMVIGAGIGGLALAVAFVAFETRIANPMLPMMLFADRAFAGANALTLAVYFGLGAVFFFLPLHLITDAGYSALEAGSAMLPFILAIGLGSRFAGGLAPRWGARRLLTAGPLIAAAGVAMLAVAEIDGGYWRSLFPGVLVLGIGMMLVVAPLTTTVMACVPSTEIGIASGINNAAARLAVLLAVAMLGALATWTFQAALPQPLAAELGDAVQKLGAALPDGADAATAAAVRDAAATAFTVVMAVSATVMATGAVIAATTLRR